MPEFEILKKIIIGRRTVKDFDGRAVSNESLASLLDLATWAPNHYMNAPWFFRVLTQDGIKTWIEELEQKCSATDLVLITKSIEKLCKVGAVIHVTSKREDNANLQNENHAAVCAAVQNILLGATALGLQSFWSTSKIISSPETKDFLKISPNEEIIGALWLGYGSTPEAKPRVAASDRSIWIGK